MSFVFGDDKRFRKKVRISLWLFLLFLILCFALIPLGKYLIWISAGLAFYFLFLTVYYAVLSSQAKFPYRKKPKETAYQKETRAYIRYHLPLLISLLLAGLLLALVILFFT